MQEKVEIKVIHWHKIDVDKPDTWPEKGEVVILYTQKDNGNFSCIATGIEDKDWYQDGYKLTNGQLWHYALDPPSELTQQD